MCASRERRTVRWWNLFIVIPVLQLSSSLARPLINHSSTTHRLAKSPFLSRSRPPYRSRNLAVPLEGYLETADGPRSEERRRGRANAFIYALGFEQSSRSKVDEDRRGIEKRNRVSMLILSENYFRIIYIFELLTFELKSEDWRIIGKVQGFFADQRKRERKIKRGEGGRIFCMCVARRAAVLSFLHLDSLFFFPSSSSEASKEQRGERVPMSQYLDRRSRRPVPTLRSDRQDRSPLGSWVRIPLPPPPSPYWKIDRDILS